VLTIVILAFHVFVALILVLLILLHSGRGSGLSDMFGGMGSSALSSTVMERNLDRITVGATIVFAFTTTILTIRLQ